MLCPEVAAKLRSLLRAGNSLPQTITSMDTRAFPTLMQVDFTMFTRIGVSYSRFGLQSAARKSQMAEVWKRSAAAR